jgi:C4-dicarboxylate transporter, DctM subunit
MSEVWIGIIGLLVLLVLFLTGFELGVAMGLVGLLGFSYIVSFHAGLSVVAQDIYGTLSSYGFTVIPLFIFMGQIAFNAGIAKNLYDTSNKFVGHIPGGLAMATVLGAAAFKALCGSAIATAATFASVAVPEMDRYGYDKRLSTGIVATVGTLGILVPPSGVLIIFGMITQQSIGKLFLAGLIPGLIITLFFIMIIYGWCRINPSLGPKGEKFTWKARISSLPEVLWALVIFLVVIGGLMRGFFTPTEAGGVGAFAVLVLSVAKRGISLKGFIKSVGESLRSSCMILLLIVGSTILGHFLAVTKIPMIAADWTMKLPLNRYLIVVLISIIYQLGGSFIDDIAFMILATPIFYPVIIKLGFDPIWFGMIIAVTLMIGVVIPPVASNVFVVKNITKVPFGVIYSGVYPFLVSLIVCGFLLFLFPQLALFLPSLLMK